MGNQEEKLSYSKAGVHIDVADALIRKISGSIKKTYLPGVIGHIGGFSAFFEPTLEGYKNPVLLATTDGVGTKLKVALEAGRLKTIGIDLVGMCVNDLVVHGGKPLFFLDYYATGRLNATSVSDVIKGIAKGCAEARCSLIGGETAEMPSLYREGDFDLAGFCVGIAEKNNIVTGEATEQGDVLLGLPSSGFHSNGYSLIRKCLLEGHKLSLDEPYPGSRSPLWKVLLKPTRIYVRPILTLLEKVKVKGMAHITGGGIYDNVRRILPDGFKAVIYEKKMKVPALFHTLQELGMIDKREMFKTFNMGTGIVLTVGRKDVAETSQIMKEMKLKVREIGEVEKSPSGKKEVEVVP